MRCCGERVSGEWDVVGRGSVESGLLWGEGQWRMECCGERVGGRGRDSGDWAGGVRFSGRWEVEGGGSVTEEGQAMCSV